MIEFGRILTGRITCTVIFVPAVTFVLGRGYPMLILCANAAETIEAKVMNDESFIVESK